MRVTAFSILFFFVCLNLSFYIINETQVLPQHVEAIETPTSIKGITIDKIISGGVVLAIGTLISIALKQYILGGAITIILFALQLIAPVVNWILFGFPRFVASIGVPSPYAEIFYTTLTTIFAVVFFWFLVGVVSQRYME